MATESKANKNATATCIVQVVRLISLKLLKLVTHETLNTDWICYIFQNLKWAKWLTRYISEHPHEVD